MNARPGDAEEFARVIEPVIAEARASGAKSYREIAAILNYLGIPTRWGNKWAPQSVKNAIRFSGMGK